MTRTQVDRLEDLCVSIYAHEENDYEVTLGGNGTNPAEAANVADAILNILYGDASKWRKAHEKRIAIEAKRLSQRSAARECE